MHIVVVDPSRVVLKVIAGLLEPRGHKVSPFSNSRDALACVTDDSTVDALITSLEVQPLSGLELAWSARLIAEARRPLYVIAMSSVRNARNLAEALDSGADDFIDKPPGAEELYARLRAAERVNTMQRELIELAETDALTGLLNRRALMQRAREAASRATMRAPLCALLLDIDHFKRVNDQHGHDVGDRVIHGVAQEVQRDGIAGRIGGEEFAIVLPNLNIAAAEAAAATLRLRCSQLRFKGARGPIQVTCSIGVAEWTDSDTIESLFKRADIALYEAKTSGRDRVVSAAADLVLARTA